MKAISTIAHDVTLGFTWRESALVGNTLNEFVNGLRIDDDELERRLGCGRSVLRPMQQQLASCHRDVWQDDRCDHSDSSSEVRLQLSHAQLATVIRALRDLASGKDIEAWEFPIRLGQEPKDALKLADELEAVSRSPSH